MRMNSEAHEKAHAPPHYSRHPNEFIWRTGARCWKSTLHQRGFAGTVRKKRPSQNLDAQRTCCHTSALPRGKENQTEKSSCRAEVGVRETVPTSHWGSAAHQSCPPLAWHQGIAGLVFTVLAKKDANTYC